MTKKLLTLVLALTLIFALGVPTFAHEESCDHDVETEWYDDGYFWYERVYCTICGETFSYESGYHPVSHVCEYEIDSGCDGTAWYYRVWCPECGDTAEYQGGPCDGVSCGMHG